MLFTFKTVKCPYYKGVLISGASFKCSVYHMIDGHSKMSFTTNFKLPVLSLVLHIFTIFHDMLSFKRYNVCLLLVSSEVTMTTCVIWMLTV